MKRYGLLLCSLLLQALLTGCVQELPHAVYALDPEADGARVTLKITIPSNPSGMPGTKSLGENIELNDLRLAVFGSNGYLKEYVKAELDNDEPKTITYYKDWNEEEGKWENEQTEQGYTYTVNLPISDSRRVIHFIGNGPSSLPFGSADEILPSLMSGENNDAEQKQAYWQILSVNGIKAQKSSDGKYYIDEHGNPITAEGLKNGTQHYQVDPNTEGWFKGIQLIRNFSRIEVDAAPGSNFKVISYALYNAPMHGTIVPFNTRTNTFVEEYQSKTISDLVDARYPANLPAGTGFTAPTYVTDNFIVKDDGSFKVPAAGVGRPAIKNTDGSVKFPEKAVYIFERPIPSADVPPTFLVVYGHFDDPNKGQGQDLSRDCFYKVELYQIDRENQISRYYPIYRNFEYEVLMTKVLAPGYNTPEAAAESAGNADVSADVATTHLLDISDGFARLKVSPWIAHTFTSAVTRGSDYYSILQAHFSLLSGISGISMPDNPVKAERLPMESDGDNLIKEEFPEVGNPDENGWRTITFTTGGPTEVSRSQKIRITGTYMDGEREVPVYRDVTITVQPLQDIMVTVIPGLVKKEIGAELTLKVSIPDGLAESMFPLDFTIEPEDMTLAPANDEDKLPVTHGPSISLHQDYTSDHTKTNAFQFIRTLTYEEYESKEPFYEKGIKWRQFECKFKTTKEKSATTIWVKNADFFKYGLDVDCYDTFSNTQD